MHYSFKAYCSEAPETHVIYAIYSGQQNIFLASCYASLLETYTSGVDRVTVDTLCVMSYFEIACPGIIRLYEV